MADTANVILVQFFITLITRSVLNKPALKVEYALGSFQIPSLLQAFQPTPLSFLQSCAHLLLSVFPSYSKVTSFWKCYWPVHICLACSWAPEAELTFIEGCHITGDVWHVTICTSPSRWTQTPRLCLFLNASAFVFTWRLAAEVHQGLKQRHRYR